MFKRVLIATDLSPASHAVVQCATALRSLGAQECHLLQCLNLRRPEAPGVEQAKHLFSEVLERQKSMLEAAGFAVRTEVSTGHAYSEINRIAEAQNCGLIVVGSHGETLMNEALLGGVACAVIHHAKRPVLIIRVLSPSEKAADQPMARSCDYLEHVLFPTDFSDNAARAFTVVKHLAAMGAGEITLCHVQDQRRIDPYLLDRLEEFNRIDRERLAAHKQTLTSTSKLNVHIDISYGHPVAQILKLIADRHVSLVVMGSHGRGFLSEAMLGSVSHQIARQSPAPVLLIPGVES